MKQNYFERINDCYYMACQLINRYHCDSIIVMSAFNESTKQITDDCISDNELSGYDFSDVLDFLNECFDKLDKICKENK